MRIKLTPKLRLCLWKIQKFSNSFKTEVLKIRTDKIDNFGDIEKQEIFLTFKTGSFEDIKFPKNFGGNLN